MPHASLAVGTRSPNGFSHGMTRQDQHSGIDNELSIKKRKLLVAESGFGLKWRGFEGSPGRRELSILEVQFANVSQFEV